MHELTIAIDTVKLVNTAQGDLFADQGYKLVRTELPVHNIYGQVEAIEPLYDIIRDNGDVIMYHADPIKVVEQNKSETTIHSMNTNTTGEPIKLPTDVFMACVVNSDFFFREVN